jgi:uncharacterized protein (TIRG00374 family)
LINKAQRKIQWEIILPVLVLLFGGLGLILFDRDSIIQILIQADWKVLPGAVVMVASSNGLVSFSYLTLARLIGIQMDSFDLGGIFFTTNAINRLVRSGGAAGYSLRYVMMKPYGVGLQDVLNSSIIHFLLGCLIMLGMLPLVILYVLITQPVAPASIPGLVILLLSGVLLFFGVAIILFSERLRWSAARLVVWAGKKVARRDFSQVVERYLQRASMTVTALRQNWRGFSTVMLSLIAEWTANVLLLSICFKAFGPGLSVGGVAVMYVLATTAGVITALPGGIGIQEGMITSLAVMQGFSFEQAVLAAILYRILYTFLPYLLSFGFYPRLLKGGASEINPSNIRT